ncbi:DUF484 family protein [Erwinia sp. OLTSP20]|uniref:DUF484 domain-containing protein n=1 Tax=unclassified Erwinia TaxID=2622719 RepID=UPI000C19FDB3|nr:MULTISPECIES: DUF484 domain-containing protein [unclassified Erwinia]PIJ50782.1 DUF484 family protein [Erwinia sp. OAMSP11]PIJ72934.1 DUF484 family protein [Erwinia sp. OLSSP12]PIJ81949.1 DUF484 family protein [Erwinia sp. OLCASP19]PIJ84604.1 DUF484 family protein [Erwinia sp. OLMTSP26]PIJ86951.1 DUF484 family protein [Erwinia sp. OLMDSP33]
MKNPGEQTASEFQPDDQAVSDYLLRHPDFFIRNARQAEQMVVPHPIRGTVSLVEWQLSRQRKHIAELEEEITLLMEQAHANQQLFDRLLALQRRLASAPSLQEMLNRLHRWARDLGLAGANIRLFSDRWRLGAPSDFTQLALSPQAFEPVRIQRFGKQQHYLGSLNGPELLQLLPQAKAIGSVAMSLMGEQGELGVLIFSSRDAQHYQTGMGTVLLQHLSAMMPDLLLRWVEQV